MPLPQSLTPRTDLECQDGDMLENWVSADFARQLERELNEAKSILKDVVEHGPYAVPSASDRRFVLMACEDARKRAKQFIERPS